MESLFSKDIRQTGQETHGKLGELIDVDPSGSHIGSEIKSD